MRTLILFVGAAILFASVVANVIAQDPRPDYVMVDSEDDVPRGVAFRTITNEDGSESYEYSVLAKPNSAYAYKSLENYSFSEGERNVYATLLNASGDVDALLDLELTPEQTQSFDDLKSQYREEIATADRSEHGKIAAGYVYQLRAIFLDEQLLSIHRLMRPTHLFQFLVSERAVGFLDISDSQLASLKQKCDEENRKIKAAIEQVKKLTEERQKGVESILNTLSAEQRVKLREVVGVEQEAPFGKKTLPTLYTYTQLAESE